MRCVQILVSGRVQGVGFRYWTERQARTLGLVGWVRNRADGDVEILVQGPDDAVSRMLEWCREGPAGARVDDVQQRDQPADEPLSSFTVRY